MRLSKVFEIKSNLKSIYGNVEIENLFGEKYLELHFVDHSEMALQCTQNC